MATYPVCVFRRILARLLTECRCSGARVNDRSPFHSGSARISLDIPVGRPRPSASPSADAAPRTYICGHLWIPDGLCFPLCPPEDGQRCAQAKSPLERPLKNSPAVVDETISSDDPCGCLAKWSLRTVLQAHAGVKQGQQHRTSSVRYTPVSGFASLSSVRQRRNTQSIELACAVHHATLSDWRVRRTVSQTPPSNMPGLLDLARARSESR